MLQAYLDAVGSDEFEAEAGSGEKLPEGDVVWIEAGDAGRVESIDQAGHSVGVGGEIDLGFHTGLGLKFAKCGFQGPGSYVETPDREG